MLDPTSQRRFALRGIGAVFVVAVLVNYPWAMAQAVLYGPMGTLLQGVWRCFVASLGDGVLVLLIFVTGCVVFGRTSWTVAPRGRQYALTLAVGVAIAVVVEWRALCEGRWSYRPEMPLLPGTQIGVVPILQMLVLPPIIFRVAAKLSWRETSGYLGAHAHGRLGEPAPGTADSGAGTPSSRCLWPGSFWPHW